MKAEGGKIEGKRISAEVDHFTKYAVLVVDGDTGLAVTEEPAAKSTNETPNAAFRDVVGHWAESSINRAASSGFVDGYADGTFRPNAEITRSEMAVMVANASDLIVDPNAATGFADDRLISTWAKGAVNAIRTLGLVKGRSSGEFDPTGKTTRAEAVTVLLGLLDVTKE
ncbi:S-layer homology domain-containing protein [Cohnella panacarvi]|uniref:S-layer homology domain-containing protein n=1 Tax=Cohnella panacarvi TaxID=400776 RepID=UPI00047BD686|nr:S-layer homology domain-containing protein [Cohnella panacarvi]